MLAHRPERLRIFFKGWGEPAVLERYGDFGSGRRT